MTDWLAADPLPLAPEAPERLISGGPFSNSGTDWEAQALPPLHGPSGLNHQGQLWALSSRQCHSFSCLWSQSSEKKKKKKRAKKPPFCWVSHRGDYTDFKSTGAVAAKWSLQKNIKGVNSHSHKWLLFFVDFIKRFVQNAIFGEPPELKILQLCNSLWTKQSTLGSFDMDRKTKTEWTDVEKLGQNCNLWEKETNHLEMFKYFQSVPAATSRMCTQSSMVFKNWS